MPRQAKNRFGVFPKACFKGKKKENTYTPKRLQGVCGGPLRAVLVYRFWPPTKGGRPQRGGTNLGVGMFLCGRSLPKHPHDRPYRSEHTRICTPSLGTTALWPYSNGAVQIRVGLELAEFNLHINPISPSGELFFNQKISHFTLRFQRETGKLALWPGKRF